MAGLEGQFLKHLDLLKREVLIVPKFTKPNEVARSQTTALEARREELTQWLEEQRSRDYTADGCQPLHSWLDCPKCRFVFDISPYLHVQNIALRVLRDIVPFIKAGNTESGIADVCAQLLQQSGAKDCWYHNVPALVLVGERTTFSVSGTDYQPSDVAIRVNDLVTIDLSPMVNDCWGDCARSYIVESGRVILPDKSSALDHGKNTERALHALMKEVATPKTSMHELYCVINQSIEKMGYWNLDFRANLGHSIEKHMNDRRFIEEGSQTRLRDCDLFTLEPHICRAKDMWGFKMENIYYFEDDKAVPLGSPDLLEAIS